MKICVIRRSEWPEQFLFCIQRDETFKTIQIICLMLALVVTTARLAVAKVIQASASQSPAQSAETLRTQLFQTRIALKTDVSKAQALLMQSAQIYRNVFAPEFQAVASEIDAQAQRHFAEATLVR